MYVCNTMYDVHVCMYVILCMYVCVILCLNVCIYVYVFTIYIHTYIHTYMLADTLIISNRYMAVCWDQSFVLSIRYED